MICTDRGAEWGGSLYINSKRLLCWAFEAVHAPARRPVLNCDSRSAAGIMEDFSLEAARRRGLYAVASSQPSKLVHSQADIRATRSGIYQQPVHSIHSLDTCDHPRLRGPRDAGRRELPGRKLAPPQPVRLACACWVRAFGALEEGQRSALSPGADQSPPWLQGQRPCGSRPGARRPPSTAPKLRLLPPPLQEAALPASPRRC